MARSLRKCLRVSSGRHRLCHCRQVRTRQNDTVEMHRWQGTGLQCRGRGISLDSTDLRPARLASRNPGGPCNSPPRLPRGVPGISKLRLRPDNFPQCHRLSPPTYSSLKPVFRSKKNITSTRTLGLLGGRGVSKPKNPLQSSTRQKLLSHENEIQVIRKLAQ